MSDGAQQLDRTRLGAGPQARVTRYDDNDIILEDAEQVEPGSDSSDAGGSIILSWNQAHAFTAIVANTDSDAAAETRLPHVKHIPVGAEWSLGTDQTGTTAYFERNMTSEFHFSADGTIEQECLLTIEQAQDLYQLLRTYGYHDLWGVGGDALGDDIAPTRTDIQVEDINTLSLGDAVLFGDRVEPCTVIQEASDPNPGNGYRSAKLRGPRGAYITLAQERDDPPYTSNRPYRKLTNLRLVE